MRVLIDDNVCDIDVQTVGEAIAAGASMVEPERRLIIEVFVDGSQWQDDRLDSPEWVQSTAGEVSLVSAGIDDLVCSTFADAAVSLDEADALQREAAELIQSDRAAEAMERLSSALTIWSAVQQAVEVGAQAAQLDLDAVVVGERDAEAVIRDLQERLGTVRTALQGGDPIELSDTLLYDLPDVVAGWQDLLEQLQQTVRGGA